MEILLSSTCIKPLANNEERAELAAFVQGKTRESLEAEYTDITDENSAIDDTLDNINLAISANEQENTVPDEQSIFTAPAYDFWHDPALNENQDLMQTLSDIKAAAEEVKNGNLPSADPNKPIAKRLFARSVATPSRKAMLFV